MTAIRLNINKAVALVIILSLSSLTALGNVAPGSTDALVAPELPLSGNLITYGNKPVSLNGNNAATGTTVFTGAQLRTPGEVSATVLLPALGRLEVSPQTVLTLTFDRKRVDVVVTEGEAVLTTAEGVAGTVTKPTGETAESAPAAGPAPQGRGRTHGLRRALIVTLLAGAAGAIIIAAIIANREDEPVSPARVS